MQAQVNLPQVPVDKIFERIFTTRQITRFDQRLLMSALLNKDSLNEQEKTLVNRLYDYIKNGWLWVGD